MNSFPKFVEVEFSKLSIETHVFLMKTYPTFSSLSCHFLQIKKPGIHPSLTCAVLLLDIWKSTQQKKKKKERDKTDKLSQSSSNPWLFWKDSLQRFFTLKAFLEALRWSRKPNLHKTFQELIFSVCAKLLQLCPTQLDTVGHNCVTLWTVPARLLCSWDFSGKNTGVDCHFLLQGIFLAQGSKPRLLGLLHCR